MPRAPEDFGTALTDLLKAAGRTIDGLLELLEPGVVARSILYDWTKARHLPHGTGPLLAVVELCLELADDRGADLGTAPGDVDGWLALLAEAKQSRDSHAARKDPRAAAAADSAAEGPAEAAKPIGRWKPTKLGIHQAIGGEPLPTYARRPHDDLLYAMLDPAVAANRLVVLRGKSSTGKSSTGKSRAAYQAVTARLSRWPLFYPRTASALTDLISQGVPQHSVLWLNELRHYADDPAGAPALFKLAELMEGRDYVVAITAVWPPLWAKYTTDHDGAPGTVDTGRASRELLSQLPKLANHDPRQVKAELGGVIDVPTTFTEQQLAQIRRRRHTTLMEAITAAERAGSPGQLTQYLAGVPDLLDHYQRPGANPYGKALITAAMDAVRLGHTQHLGREFLRHAAIGELSPEQRAIDDEDVDIWEKEAWKYATYILKGTVRALQPIAPKSNVGVVGYRLAESLDQHGRYHRADQTPPPAFWKAAAAHAHPSDLYSLALAAQRRGLYRDAAQLLKSATAHGSQHAASALIDHLRTMHPSDHSPARWAAEHVALDDPKGVGELLERLQGVGAHEQVTALLARDPAEHVALDDPKGVGELLDRLQGVGAHEQVTALAKRAEHVALDDPKGVGELLDRLQGVGAHEQVTALAKRAVAHVAHVALDDPDAVAWLLNSLRGIETHEQVTALAKWAVAHVALDDPNRVNFLLYGLRQLGADEQITALLAARDPAVPFTLDDAARFTLNDPYEQVTALARRVAAHAALDNPRGVSQLLVSLWHLKAHEQVAALARRVAAHVALDNPDGVGELLERLQGVGAHEQVTALAKRAEHVALDNPYGVGELLERLQGVGAHEQVTALAKRAAAHAALDSPDGVGELLYGLQGIGAHEQVTALAKRAAAHAALDNPVGVSRLLERLQGVGAHEQVTALLARDPAEHVALDNPYGVSWLLGSLRRVGAHEQVTALLARDPAEHVALDNRHAVRSLLESLQRVGAHEQITALAERLPAAGLFGLFLTCTDHAELFRFGRELDRSAAAQWVWEDLD
ncbi:hypothetical protein GCM10022248_89900 [Nonomuraea soli]